MHTIVLDSDGQPQQTPSLFAYKVVNPTVRCENLIDDEQFLLQVHDLVAGDFIASTPDKNGDISLSASFDFHISNIVLSKASGIPQQCLQLPPSITVGTEIKDDHSAHTYAQPKISYSLVAEVDYESADGRRMRLSSMKEIPLWTFSTPSPPLDTKDFPTEFVETICHTCRPNRFRKETFLLRVSCREPTVVVLSNRKISGSTSCSIFIALEDTRLGYDISRLSVAAQSIAVKVAPTLRIKTFYSIQPFSQMPGQNMLATKRGTRLHDELRVSSSTSYSNLTWHNKADGTSQREAGIALMDCALLAQITVTIQLPAGLPPSFCSAVVARQYSLIVECNIRGVRVENFRLELPLQIVYSGISQRCQKSHCLGTSSLKSASLDGAQNSEHRTTTSDAQSGPALNRQEKDAALPLYDL